MKDQMIAKMKSLGYTPSMPRVLDGKNYIYIFSVEIIPGTYGHPVAELAYDKHTGSITLNGRPTTL